VAHLVIAEKLLTARSLLLAGRLPCCRLLGVFRDFVRCVFSSFGDATSHIGTCSRFFSSLTQPQLSVSRTKRLGCGLYNFANCFFGISLLCHQQPPPLGVGQCDNQTILSCRAFSKGARWPLVQLPRSASTVVAATMFPGDRQCCSAALPPADSNAVCPTARRQDYAEPRTAKSLRSANLSQHERFAWATCESCIIISLT
jgi:hypothetical protein